MSSRFCRYELRTTDVEAARGFYSRLLGHDRTVLWALHEQARARGAVPHWLGSLDVEDAGRLEAITARFVQRGAALLGPTFVTREGSHANVLRDPGGAILGLTTRPSSGFERTVDVRWHVLNTVDLAAAIGNYQVLFGWSVAGEPLPGPDGSFHEFSWGPEGSLSAGVMADIAGRPGIHPHWLYFFVVTSVDDAVELTRRAGGTATDPLRSPTGPRISICEDPQRAAFGVMESTP